ncbi:lipocalin-like domain-containing protein [Leptolyngbya sp. KIOST-1]|nr:lipocalin-like domain-containing protein [Leptolyngbya sp. KIOST-1]
MIPTDLHLGTWRLVAVRAIHPHGSVVPDASGPNSSGLLTYTANG